MIKALSSQSWGNISWGNMACVLINKILLRLRPILHLNDLLSKNTSCLYDAVIFARLLFINLDTYLMKTESDVYTRICTQLTFDLILGLDLASTHIVLETHQGTL